MCVCVCVGGGLRGGGGGGAATTCEGALTSEAGRLGGWERIQEASS